MWMEAEVELVRGWQVKCPLAGSRRKGSRQAWLIVSHFGLTSVVTRDGEMPLPKDEPPTSFVLSTD